MPARRALREQDVHAFLKELYETDLHARRVYSLANATLGVLTSGSLAVHLIGLGLAQARGMSTKHSVKQVDRLLSNRGVDPWELFAQWVPYLVAQREAILVALDWTDFDKDGHATVMLSLLCSHGRSTPLVWQTVHKSALKGERNDDEDQVLERLKQCLPAGVAVTVLADRGFCDRHLFEYLEDALGFGYVIRMRGNINVTDGKGTKRAAQDWVGHGGRARTLRGARVTDDGYGVATVVCGVQAKGMQEAWCLASSDPQAKAATLVNHYAKRWGIGVSSQGHIIQSVEVRPGSRDSGPVAREAPWRESKTVEPSDQVLAKEDMQRTRLQRAVNAEVASLHVFRWPRRSITREGSKGRSKRVRCDGPHRRGISGDMVRRMKCQLEKPSLPDEESSSRRSVL